MFSFTWKTFWKCKSQITYPNNMFSGRLLYYLKNRFITVQDVYIDQLSELKNPISHFGKSGLAYSTIFMKLVYLFLEYSIGLFDSLQHPWYHTFWNIQLLSNLPLTDAFLFHFLDLISKIFWFSLVSRWYYQNPGIYCKIYGSIINRDLGEIIQQYPQRIQYCKNVY